MSKIYLLTYKTTWPMKLKFSRKTVYGLKISVKNGFLTIQSQKGLKEIKKSKKLKS